MPSSPSAVNLDISPPVLASPPASRVAQNMGTGNLAPKNPPPGMILPPPPAIPPPHHLRNNAVNAAAAATPAAPPPKQGTFLKETTTTTTDASSSVDEDKNAAAAASFKAPTTFFSHELYYNEPKKIDASKLRVAAESTYGRRGRMSMSRARDVAIAGSALRARKGPSRSDDASGTSPLGAAGTATRTGTGTGTRGAEAGDSRAALRAEKIARANARANAIKAAALAQTTSRHGGAGRHAANVDDVYVHKRRVMRALDVEREELPDGSILFRFSEKPLSAKEERALITEEEAEAEAAEVEVLHNHADEYQPHISVASGNVVSRWMMTVQFLASTLSLESAAFYVLSTPFRTGFWTVAYTLRLVWWLCSGRLLPGRAGKRAKAVRGGGGGGGAFAAIDVQATKMESKRARAGKVSSGTVNGRDMRNVLLS